VTSTPSSPKSGDVTTLVEKPLVRRSIVEQGLPYTEYRQDLRRDFIHSCGYCSLCESEAQGLAFQIDHYEPQSRRPDLKDIYSNLMYACDECNRLKSDIVPPESAAEAGYRFYRPDTDLWGDHFASTGMRLSHTSNVGEFSIEALDLNRQSLRRLRELRSRLWASSEQVAKGILGLRRFRVDQLPPSIRSRAAAAIARVELGAEVIGDKVDDVLRDAAHSPLIDPDADKSGRRDEWRGKFDALKGLYPGAWRGRNAAS
jgi:hypothetical protein